MERLINIQIWHPTATVWDDVLPTQHEVKNPAEVAQAISDATGKLVRMTYHRDGINVGSLNGSYFTPTLNEFQSWKRNP